MEHSATLASLAEALSKAQGEMQPAKMDSKNPFLKNKFAGLGSVIENARPVLAKHGLSIVQFPVSGLGQQVGIETVIFHSSGEWIGNTIMMAASEQKGLSDAQAVGVVISYLRRYSFSAVCAMYADEDTDGNAKHEQDGQAAVQAEKQERAEEKNTPVPPAPTGIDRTAIVVPLGDKCVPVTIKAGYFDSTFAAAAVLAKYPAQKAPLGKILDWCAAYRKAKNELEAEHPKAEGNTEAAILVANSTLNTLTGIPREIPGEKFTDEGSK